MAPPDWVNEFLDAILEHSKGAEELGFRADANNDGSWSIHLYPAPIEVEDGPDAGDIIFGAMEVNVSRLEGLFDFPIDDVPEPFIFFSTDYKHEGVRGACVGLSGMVNGIEVRVYLWDSPPKDVPSVHFIDQKGNVRNKSEEK